MPTQSLLIGLGGTGSRVVNNVAKLLKKNGQTFNDGQICCAVLDSDQNDAKAIEGSGTSIPVFSISKPQSIETYFSTYRNRKITEWSPDSPVFRKQSMLDGCSEVRVKSRIAFLDYVETKMNEELGTLINDVLRNNVGTVVRVMIVSSLSGGTGSGMIIQTAQWLREHLSQSQVVIRGIALLPDVFIDTLKNVRENATTKNRHYANAYAAIRELNAITKIQKNVPIAMPSKIEIEGLFDSTRDADRGKPVFDYFFFIDSKNANGVGANSMSEYEKMVAQLIYMQLYSPIAENMRSVEDNFFLAFSTSDNPLYGACGSSKAEYPVDSVKTYCAIRATQDSIQNGWNRIDSEIAAKRKELRARERDGRFQMETFDPRAEYIKLFDAEISRSPEEHGRDRFFVTIKTDVKNEKKVTGTDGKVTIQYSDKIDDFIKNLKHEKIEAVVTDKNGVNIFERDVEAFVDEDHDKTQLEEFIKTDEDGMEDAVEDFERNVEDYADDVVNAVFPLNMGDVNPNNECSIYGIATKPTDEGRRAYIHPVALRYLLCKTVAKMRAEIRATNIDSLRNDALTGGDPGSAFDNVKTRRTTETTPQEMLDSRRWFQNEARFFDLYERKYSEFINNKVGLCKKYEAALLTIRVYEKLIERVNALLTQLEAFFKRLPDIQEKLDDELIANIKATSDVVGNTYYVFGNRACKESVYEELDFTSDRTDEISKSVIETAYGRLCAEMRPETRENKKYTTRGIAAEFLNDSVRTFRSRIDSNPNNREIVNINIYTAICRQCDTEAADRRTDEQREQEALDFVNLEEGTTADLSDRNPAYNVAFRRCADRLFAMAAPMLICTPEPADENNGATTQMTKTFWGFHTSVAAAYNQIGAVLGTNADTEQNAAYPINELHCYRAIYGLDAKYIPKFSETEDGIYYKCYKDIVNKMVRKAAGESGERAYISTPHIDKRWHSILPYITDEKNESSRESFFRGVWLALAYGMIQLNADKKFCMRRQVRSGDRMNVDYEVAIKHNNQSISRNDIYRLIDALNADLYFKDIIVPELERKYIADVSTEEKYEDTKVFKGLMNKPCGFTPVDFVVAYYNGLSRDINVVAPLVGAIDRIAEEVASKFDLDTDVRRAERAKYEMCKSFYDAADATEEKEKLFREWVEKFNELKL